jgi:hypothetical protein
MREILWETTGNGGSRWRKRIMALSGRSCELISVAPEIPEIERGRLRADAEEDGLIQAPAIPVIAQP